MAQSLGGKTSATEAEQIQVGSYAQTEMQFIEHSDHLMPRVHQMRTDLAQWYNCTKPSVKLQITTSEDERVNFEINGEDLLLTDIHVYCTTKANYRQILDQMKQLAMNNNTSGANIYDLGKIMQTDSLGTLNSTLKEIENKMVAQRKEEQQHEQDMLRMQQEQALKEKSIDLDFEARESEKRDRKDILVAEIRASGMGALQDIDKNGQSDFIDNMNNLKKTEQFQQIVDIQQQKVDMNSQQHRDKIDLKREQMNLQRELKDKDVAIAQQNKNKYDVLVPPPKKEKPKNKK
jgi:hypothetical protein